MRVALLLIALLLPISAYAEATSTAETPRGVLRTYVTFPEWYIVYSAQEYADFVESGGLPSAFPYFDATRQYWKAVEHSTHAASGSEIDKETASVLRFIGISFTLENALIGGYEKSLGRLSEALSSFNKTPVDTFTDAVASEYGDFLVQTPWYDFPYFSKLPALLSTYLSHPTSFRATERVAVFTTGYTLKGIYGKLTLKLAEMSFGKSPSIETTSAIVTGVPSEEARALQNVLSAIQDGDYIHVSALRYRAFTQVAVEIARLGGEFVTIQGNDTIMLTVVAPSDAVCITARTDIAFSMTILTQPQLSRFALSLHVPDLAGAIRELEGCNLSVEHVYDY